MEDSSTKVTIKKIADKHVGDGYAVIGRDIMESMTLKNGDYIKIKNPTKEVNESSYENIVFARVLPRNTEENGGDSTIRIDSNLRNEIDINTDDTAIIQRADLKVGESIEFAIPERYSLSGDSVASILLRGIRGQAVKVGQSIQESVGMGNQKESVEITISDASPENAVIVTKQTSGEIKTVASQHDKERSEINNNTVAYEDIGGLDRELNQVREMIELPMSHPEIFKRLGIESPKGVLLHGPPGTGKTLIAKAVANESDASFFSISGPEIMSKYYGESEEKLREVFEEATEESPSIIFMDELDSIATERGGSDGDVERRIVAQLLSLMDGLEERSDVIVIGATNRIDAIDSALRRGGRFDREVEVTAPNKEGRREILDVHTRSMPLGDEIDLDEYADMTHGFVGADLESLCKESAMTALRRVKPELDVESDEITQSDLEGIFVEGRDFRDAIKDIEPSALREVFVEVPDTNWNDIGGLQDTKDRMREVVQWPLLYEDVFENMNLDPAKGVLLYGPPGTGKTLLAKAVANESKSNFISIKGPELLNKYVGESERGIREVFEKARSNAPTIVFFDEIDALAVERGQGGSNNVGERVVSQLLTELDGLENLEDVVVIATTNRPDLIDSALLRPGRLDRHIHVPVPNQESRREVIRVHTEDVPLADDVDIGEIAERTEGYVGADIEALCREATMQSTRDLVEDIDPEDDEDKSDRYNRVSMSDFEHALDKVTKSVNEDTEDKYQEIEERFEQNRVTQTDKSRIGFQ